MAQFDPQFLKFVPEDAKEVFQTEDIVDFHKMAHKFEDAKEVMEFCKAKKIDNEKVMFLWQGSRQLIAQQQGGGGACQSSWC